MDRRVMCFRLCGLNTCPRVRRKRKTQPTNEPEFLWWLMLLTSRARREKGCALFLFFRSLSGPRTWLPRARPSRAPARPSAPER